MKLSWRLFAVNKSPLPKMKDLRTLFRGNQTSWAGRIVKQPVWQEERITRQKDTVLDLPSTLISSTRISW
jgi:hypothetical protein